MNHAGVLKRALGITWRHKSLWLFGFLLALVSGGGRGVGQHAQFTMSRGDRLSPAIVLALAIVLMLVVLIAMLVNLVVGYLSRAALMRMVQEIEEKDCTSVRSGLRVGWSRLLRLFGIDLAIGIPATVAALLMFALALSPLVLLAARATVLTVLGIALTAVLVLGAIVVLSVVAFALAVLLELAHRRCVLEKQGVLDSIRASCRLARASLGDVAMMGLILLAIDLAAGLMAIPLAFAMVATAAVPALVVFAVTRAALLAVATGMVVLLPGMLLLALGSGIYQVFRSSTWTLAYLRLAAHSPSE